MKGTALYSNVHTNKQFGTALISRSLGVFRTLIGSLFVVGLVILSVLASRAPAHATDNVKTIKIVYLREEQDKLLPISLLDLPTEDRGFAGGELGIKDNNTTGSFLGQKFELEKFNSKKPEDLIAKAVESADAGRGLLVVDVSASTLVKIADAVKGKDAIVLNAGLPDISVREENCRLNVKHTAPSYAQLADGLTQYLAWKKWRKWFLVKGPAPEDEMFAEALRRAAKKFGMKIVEEKTYTYDAGARRTDGGYDQIQQQIPKFTQKAPEHDVVVVADEAGLFGAYFPYRTWDARPVAGSVGLYAASWHPAVELWGGSQFQNRFKRQFNRHMTALDYDAWVAVRAIGEAATRTNAADAKTLVDYMRSPDFEIAAFKGQKLTFRKWNGQLRQPIFVVTDKLHVTVSPQKEYLHKNSELDTLGIDQPKTKCKAFTN